MPLLDHFHLPLSVARHWEGFFCSWACSIANALNREPLPRDYFAELHLQVGVPIEADLCTSYPPENPLPPKEMWAPPAPAIEMPTIFPDSVEVRVFSTEGGPTLVAAVELISPGNKDRPETRRSFAAKCASYLHQGIGLITVDIVTSRQANLHNELIDLLQVGSQFLLTPDSLFAVAYRPVRQPQADKIQVWPALLNVGQPLPLLPLALDKGICVPLDFEAAYTEACQRSRLP